MQYNQPPDRRPMSAANKLLIVIVVLLIFTAGFLSIMLGRGGQPVGPVAPTPVQPSLPPQGQLNTIDEALDNITPTPPPTPVVMASAPPTETPVPNFEMTPAPTDIPTLKLNSAGDQVRRMQDRLVQLGYLRDGANDGQFGKGTQNAVRSFQEVNGLSVDGAAGAKTLTLLYSDDAKPKP